MDDPFWDQIIDPIMGRPMLFDKSGQAISERQWSNLRWKDGKRTDYPRIASDDIGDVRVSTIWLGMDHGYPEVDDEQTYRPVIFETMIFGGDYGDSLTRYCTEDEALKGHLRTVVDLRAGLRPWFLSDDD